MQQSAAGGALVPPIPQVIFPSDAITLTTYDVGVTEGDAMLVLVEPVGTGSQCIAAVGIGGTVTVTAYTAITGTTDGGSITLNGSGISLYHPSATPAGAVSFGTTALCPFQ
jgi:hypothetical protein